MLMVVLIGFTAVGFSNLLSTSVKQRNELSKIKNARVLRDAKEALLSYAVDYAVSGDLDDMGKLPCPDITDTAFPGDIEGNQDPNCGARGVNSFGYFPFKEVGKGIIEDSSSECLWYIVSGDYKNWVESDLLNWDSVGYLNLVDENDSLKHGVSEDDFPIAFIISPGATINQNRVPNAALPQCRANYALASYLEGGPNINYAVDLPLTADTLWEILTTSEAAYLNDVGYNDQVIAIYRNEFWNRIQQMNDLSTDNTAGVAATSRIELLTFSLAECIAAYGNAGAGAGRLLPYPAPIDLDPANLVQDEYRNNLNYDDDNTIRYGRFPQVLDNSVINHANFVLDTNVAQSYCEAAGVTAYDELFWKNWKDHFYYIVSEDFDSVSAVPDNINKCDAGAGTGSLTCIRVDGKIDKVAAMVIFTGSALAGQDRIWWWDDATGTATIDNKSFPINYLDGGNQVVYVAGNQNYLTNNPPQNDYMYCIEFNNASSVLTAIKCSDLDDTL